MQNDTDKTRDWSALQYGADDARNFTTFDEDFEELAGIAGEGGIQQVLWKTKSILQQDNAKFFALVKNIEVERDIAKAWDLSYRDATVMQDAGSDESEAARLATRKEDAITIMDSFYAIELATKAVGIHTFESQTAIKL